MIIQDILFVTIKQFIEVLYLQKTSNCGVGGWGRGGEVVGNFFLQYPVGQVAESVTPE